MKKRLLILTKEDGARKILGDDVDIIIPKDFSFNEVEGKILSDSKTINQINESFISSPDFIAYHNNGIYKGEKSDDGYLDNTIIKGFSHEEDAEFPDNFYNVVFPKIYQQDQGNLTLLDVEKYFPSILENTLRLLHDINSGKSKKDLETNKDYKDLLEKSESIGYFEDFFSNEIDENFNKLRDQLTNFVVAQ